MKCSHCGYVGSEGEFTKGNISKNGHLGRCKKCKALLDKKHYQKKTSIFPSNFELNPDMLLGKKARIGVLKLKKIVDRRFNQKTKTLDSNFGLKAVLSELNEAYEICYPQTINQYEKILVSITSVMDIENLIYTFEKYCLKEVAPEVIIGGFGVINIKLIIPYIDVAVFGRAEGQINEIINGWSFKNVWRKSKDPEVEKKYQIRQPQYLLPGEQSVGCRNKCAYCQYTHIRKSIGKPDQYHPGDGINTQETDWHSLKVTKPGKYITAWDGWSEPTRLRVKKYITDEHIKNKLVAIGNNRDITKTVSLKIFQIVGYPWETKDSVLKDIDDTINILKYIDQKISGKIHIAFMVTPFGPEPTTPMQYEPCNITTNWNNLLRGKKLYYGNHIKAFIIASLMGPYSLLKRIFINRAEKTDLNTFKNIAYDSRLKRMAGEHQVNWLIKNNKINTKMFSEIQNGAFDFLYV